MKRTESASRVGRKPVEMLTADLQGALRAAGLRSTGARLAVLRYLHVATGPNSHGELFEALSGEGFDRATIYRNLVDLAEAGLVTRTDLGDHVWRFELKERSDGHIGGEHPHFVCVDCGGISCLPEVSVKIQSKTKAPRAVEDRKVAIHLKGICDNCD